MGYKWKHGRDVDGSVHRLYSIWHKMCRRCSNPKEDSYYNYGARGIRVCTEWLDYDTFYDWAMDNGYSKDLSLDRIDNNKGYSPDNCRWATPKAQTRNRRITVCVEGKPLAEIAEEAGLSYDVVNGRYYRLGYRTIEQLSMSIEDVKQNWINSQVEHLTKFFVEGISLKELSATYNIPYTTVYSRYKAGYKTIEGLTRSRGTRGAK